MASSGLRFISGIPLSLYLHVPWCVRKCPYCDFNSHALTPPGADAASSRIELSQERAYIDALLADLELELPLIWGRSVETLFIGGGTPSLLSPDAVERLLSGLRARLSFRPGLEITLEANPGTVEQGRFQGFREAGVNRLSLGVQSFDAHHLQRLGRVHDRNQALRAFDMAINAGFNEINVDLMFGLPEQTLAQAQADIDTVLALAPSHISYYQLTLEPNTLFYNYPPRLPDDDLSWRMQQQSQQRLAAAGFEQYEVSAYAKSGSRCRHNLNYWRFGDYLGIGAGAHGKLTNFAEGRIERRLRHKHPRRYLDAAADKTFVAKHEIVPEHELPLEFMLNALRLTDGVPNRLFSERTGLPLARILPILDRAREQELLYPLDHGRLQTTALGQRFLNDLVGLFLDA